MIKLGIIGAMAVEVNTLKEQMLDLEIKQCAGMQFYEGVLEGLPVVVVECGIGKVNAALCAQVLCSTFAVTHIVNTGIAGSLDAQLDIGDLVVSEDAMYHDLDATVFGYPIGQVPGLPVLQFAADPNLVEMAFSAAQLVHNGHVRKGRITSGDQFISDSERKDKIIANTGALCTEMEGASIAHAAWKNEIPFVIIRAISDKADGSAHMDYPTFEAEAAHRCAAVTCQMARLLQKQ